MRFDTIKDFVEYGKKCPFCGMDNSIFFDSRRFGIYADFRYVNPLYTAKYANKITDKENYLYKSNLYHTVINDNEIIFMSKFNSLKMNKIFSINMKTNDFFGDIDNSSNVIWKNNLTLRVGCKNEWCHSSGYVYTYFTNTISVERNNRKLMPLVIDSIFLSVPIKEERISLINCIENKNTTILSKREDEYGIITSMKVIASVPKFSIDDLKSKDEIEKKIKTILLFL